jgi:hypothetical protein
VGFVRALLARKRMVTVMYYAPALPTAADTVWRRADRVLREFRITP